MRRFRGFLSFASCASLLLGVLLSACGGGGGSSPGPATPPVLPTIDTPPAAVTVTEGERATFAVVAGGTAPLSYRWRRNGVDVPGATLASYTTSPTLVSDDGAQYSVVISNAAGSVTSEPVVLAVTPLPVNVAPVIVSQPLPVSAAVGAQATFQVTAASTSPVAYQWQRDGQAIPGANSASYTLLSVANVDNGAMFSVVVTNVHGSTVSQDAALSVSVAGTLRAPPRITSGWNLVSTSVIRSDGSVWAWGDNAVGQIGSGEKDTTEFAPRQVRPAGSATGLAAEGGVTLYTSASGIAYAAGLNSAGVLGNGAIVGEQLTHAPVTVADQIVLMSTNGTMVSAIRRDGTVWRWGHNPNNLGQDTATRSRQVGTITDAIDIAMAEWQLFIVRADGTVWFWGLNLNDIAAGAVPAVTRSQPGTNAPVQIPGLTDVIRISAGVRHVVALKRDGTVWTWGWNVAGQLGYATPGEFGLTPVQVPGVDQVVDVRAGAGHTVVLRRDGTVWGWGMSRAVCQAESGSPAAPHRIVGLDDVTDIAALSSRGLIAARADGRLLACGHNSLGMLGLGSSSVTYVEPTLVPNFNLHP